MNSPDGQILLSAESPRVVISGFRRPEVYTSQWSTNAQGNAFVESGCLQGVTGNAKSHRTIVKRCAYGLLDFE